MTSLASDSSQVRFLCAGVLLPGLIVGGLMWADAFELPVRGDSAMAHEPTAVGAGDATSDSGRHVSVPSVPRVSN